MLFTTFLAGGRGTRISEETGTKPKPMIEIGEIPILVHLMRWYYSFGFNDFVICAGYRAWEIKQFFLTYEFRKNHLVIDHRTVQNAPPSSFHRSKIQEKWRVRVIDTGLECMTGGRIAKAFDEVTSEQELSHFAVTYGDGLSNVNLNEELTFHHTNKKLGTVLGVPPLARFGELGIVNGNQVKNFLEKPQSRGGFINGGFFFFKKEFRNYLASDDSCVLEKTPLSKLSQEGQLIMYKHMDFWHPMDTLRDRTHLENLWDSGKAPWTIQN
ncbi:MAG: glucose-1-phosphate cytidylyltransferase [Deltaproteobacteria bacterium]|nr:glucose-1-phosphate cytidylyltransferase [Deltaproteobacteria bacterium]